MSHTSFSEQQELLKVKLRQADRLSGELFNYLKIFQHALTYHRNGDTSKLLRSPWGRSERLVRLYYRFRAKRDRRTAQGPPLTSVLVFENGRYVTDAAGKVHSAHYAQLRRALPASVQTTLLTRPNSPLKSHDHVVQKLINEVCPFPLSEHGKELMSDLNTVIRRCAKSSDFTKGEMAYITSAAHVFFEQFMGFDALLRNRGVEVALFDNHYHNEGLMAALKLNQVRCVEVQHGLIAANDLYYAYPDYVKDVAHKALFPDAVLLFGEFWKGILEKGYEHPPEHLKVVGDYSYFGGEAVSSAIPKGKHVLITAQKNMGDQYIPYAKQLAARMHEKHPGWVLRIKLHPLEKDPDAYYALKSEGIDILGNESNLMDALAASRIHISIYSTTFFDAIGLDTLNLSLQDYGVSADYAKEIVETGVALPLSVEQDPIEVYEKTDIQDTSFGDRHHYYQPFDPEALRRAVGFSQTEVKNA